MTLTFGSVCNDGVVLISDKKVTYDNGNYEYDLKLYPINDYCIIGYAGNRGAFNTYKNKIELLIGSSYNNKPKNLLDLLIKEFASNYTYKSFDILLGMSNFENSKSVLITLYHDGGFENKNHYEIGSGSHHSLLFLNQNWNPNLNMIQVSTMGYFIIRYIEHFRLQNDVGLNGGYPSIWFIPNNGMPYQAEKSFLEETKSKVEDRITSFETNINLSDLFNIST